MVMSCQKEDEDFTNPTTSQSTNNFIVKHLDYTTIKSNKNIQPSLKRITSIRVKRIINQRILTDSITGIVIDTTYANYLESIDGTYHSYTFKIANTPENAGLENLLISLQPDGSYKEFLVHYNVSQQEIDLLNAKQYVSLTNKTTFTYINTNFSNQMQRVFYDSEGCAYNEQVIYSNCSGNLNHTYQEYLENPADCTARYKPYSFTITSLISCPSNSGGEGNPMGTDTTQDANDAGGNVNYNSTTPVSCTRNCIDEVCFAESAAQSLGVSLGLDDQTISCLADEENCEKTQALDTFFTNNQTETAFSKAAAEAICNNPNIIFERMVELKEKLEVDPWLLIQDCALQNGLNTSNYLDLYNKPFPQECTDRLNNSVGVGPHQPINQGNVPLANIDYYASEVTTNPDFNQDGNPDSTQEMYQAFRNKFIDLASGSKDNFQFSCDVNFDLIVDSSDTGDISWEFEPVTFQDGVDFVSNNPIASILLIESDASGIGTLAADDGAVIVTDYTLNDWSIATIYTDNNGTQPFSGNRQWGWLINQNGNFEFFTRAVDVANVSTLISLFSPADNECQQDSYYNVAEATWDNMQQEIVQWVLNYGGQANLVPNVAVRVKRETILEILTTNTSIDQIISDCN